MPVEASVTNAPARLVSRAVWRGMRLRCPHCGEGRMFRAYLKVNDHCPVCGEDLSHHRADDAPPYLTIFVVGHIIGTLIMAVDARWDDLPIWIHLAIWLPLTLVLCLALLPIAKGGLIGLQWALRMHGFAAPVVAGPGRS